MAKSLLEQLPSIVSAGKRQATTILEGSEGSGRVGLQTRELVIPARDHGGLTMPSAGDESTALPMNRLIYGDNLLAMAAILSGDADTPSVRGKVDLIYIDPPFDSRADYRTRVTIPGATLDQKATVFEQFAYSDTWADGTASYLAMLTPRLVLIRELLADTGSLYVHLDYHVSHYVKIVLDEVFGRDNFVNELIWQRTGAHNDSQRFGNVHDSILMYGKSSARKFRATYTPYADEYIQERFRSVEEGTGRRFWLNTATAAGPGPARTFKGVLREPPRGTHWRYSQDRIDELVASGKIIFSKSGMPYVKQYLDESPGRPAQSVWSDIKMTKSGVERLAYDTQKPEALLERIIQSSSDPGDLVADLFVGSGTTAAVADRLGRNWIASDLGKPATMITRKRLIDQDASPFLYQAIGDYQIEQARSTLGRRFRVGDLARVVLDLYGALPLAREENVNGSLGRMPHGKTLVFADSPARLTTASTLRRAQAFRESKLGGFDKVVVLGWNFAAGIGQVISDLADLDLEVLVIPPDLLDRLKKKGAEKVASEIRFSSLQYLEAKVLGRYQGESSESIDVELSNYVLLSPDAINLEPASRKSLLDVMNAEPLALVEYWAVDTDYDGEVFQSVWQDYRGNVDNDGDPLRVVTKASVNAAVKQGPRTICIRAVDVFGFESEVVVTNVEVTK